MELLILEMKCIFESIRVIQLLALKIPRFSLRVCVCLYTTE